MNWHDRVEAYARLSKFPVFMTATSADYAYGMWTLGNDYRVKTGYYGGYPATYLRRVKALFPDCKKALHVFSGRVDTSEFPGDTVDINKELSPTYVDDAQSLSNVPLKHYDIVLADPPYSVEDAEHYQTTMVKRNKVMRALEGVRPGVFVVWLDQTLPMYRKVSWAVEAEIGVRRSTNHRYRQVIVFRRRGRG